MISLPCQKRYLKYIETSVIAGEQPEDIKLLFSNISMSNSPAFNEDGSCSKHNLFRLYHLVALLLIKIVDSVWISYVTDKG